MIVNSKINSKGQLETDYTGIKEYEEFLREKARIRKETKLSKKSQYKGYWHFSDEKLLDLKRQYEKTANKNEWQLGKIYDEITKRKL